MLEILPRALFLGLSTGIFCLGTCAPVMAPFMLSEERSAYKDKLRPFLLFTAGRFLAYVLIGALAGWTGGLAGNALTRSLAGISLILLALLMVIYGLTTGFPQLRICTMITPYLRGIRAPFAAGLLMGVNLCPPFLIAAADVFVTGSAFGGAAFFMVFFAATTVFLVPFIFLGYLSYLPAVRAVGRLSSLIVGAMYFFMGLNSLAS